MYIIGIIHNIWFEKAAVQATGEINMEQNVTIIATSTMGLEAIVAKEVKDLGYANTQIENGKVIIEAPLSAIPRLNMWLRTSDRIKLRIGLFQARTFDDLFEKTKALPWEDILPENASFPVTGRSVKSTLYSVPDCQAIVKKAIVERLKQRYKKEWFFEDGFLYKVEVAILKDEVSITLDTTGVGLHKRGYRSLHSAAPLKETLAAAMIKLSHWKPDYPLVDPFCGSGTIPIEAALIGRNIAPGINRFFDSEDWGILKQEWWDQAREEADDKADYDRPLDITGSDIDHRMVDLAVENTEEAGLQDAIHYKQMQAVDFTTPKEYGSIITNPPYGERVGEKEEVKELYRNLGKIWKPLSTWSVYIITSDEKFENTYGAKATKKRKLYNGNIRTDYYQYWGERPPRRS
ncbi:putative N6-adenine-specific DNA methylase [Sinobaca qinghaiensis]|uniref:Putative N6-adenine-specific DNA methylase n=2 Tax=Sinobaca qinghaiensis TaxID=342944 RepID=A0A419UWF8_9BACL|nr:putative N6-adenine-specific DNA methylase [Sinobaca qinghaiensis]